MKEYAEERLHGVRHRGRLPANNAAQSAYQAMKGLRGRVADLPDNAARSEQVGIEMYLKPTLEATETIFAQKEFMDKREVVAWHPRIAALRTLFELHGSYARARQNKIGKGLVLNWKGLGWETGIEPATFGATDRRSTS